MKAIRYLREEITVTDSRWWFWPIGFAIGLQTLVGILHFVDWLV